MTKHTQGNWRANGTTVSQDNPQGSVVVICGCASAALEPSEQEANARLIAAAPDMLAALRLAHEAINPADRVDGGISLHEWSGRLNATSAVISQTIREAEPE